MLMTTYEYFLLLVDIDSITMLCTYTLPQPSRSPLQVDVIVLLAVVSDLALPPTARQHIFNI